VKLLAQIPIVGSICEGGDGGAPIVLKESITGEAFMELGRAVADAIEQRNSDLPPTAKVETH
jgi:ATP-binding protein involved in chromosome partitioning